jgi:hypothetical protein
MSVTMDQLWAFCGQRLAPSVHGVALTQYGGLCAAPGRLPPPVAGLDVAEPIALPLTIRDKLTSGTLIQPSDLKDSGVGRKQLLMKATPRLRDSPCQIRFRRVRIARTMEESAGFTRLRKGAGDESEGGRLPGGQGHDYRTA